MERTLSRKLCCVLPQMKFSMTLEALRVTCFVTVPPTVLYKSRKLCHKYHFALFLWIMIQSWTVVENLGCWEQHLPVNIRYTKELARVCSIQRLSVLCFAGRATPAEFKFMKKLHQKGSSITGFCRDEDEGKLKSITSSPTQPSRMPHLETH